MTRPIIVIRTGGAGSRFSVERIGSGANPIYLVNEANVHFGYANVRAEFEVRDDDLESDLGIKLVERAKPPADEKA